MSSWRYGILTAALGRSYLLRVPLLFFVAGLGPNALTAQNAASSLDLIEVSSERLPPGAETAAQAGVTQNELDVDEEIVVIGDPSLRALREELRAAEDHVHDLFNALNDDDQFDIHCHSETRTGTKISRRVCKPNYVDAATDVQARAYLSFLRGDAAGASLPSQATIQYKNDILREKLTTLVNENAELREAVMHHAELSSAFDSTRQRVLYTNE